MAGLNGHFAAVGNGNGATAPNYEHGVQVIDGDKEFKYVRCAPGR